MSDNSRVRRLHLKKLLIKLGLIYPEPERSTRDKELIKEPGLRFTEPQRSSIILGDAAAPETGKRLFGGLSPNRDEGEGHARQEISIEDYYDQVPRYPPYQTPIPAAPVEMILRKQSKLINKIATKFTHDDKMFLNLVYPVIFNLCKHIHLLPASRAHHHARLGGAIRHALEAADIAASGALSILKDKRIKNCDAEAYQLRIQVACIVAALLHDAGKPLSDIAVTDEKADEEWNPYTNNLLDWLHSRGTTSYFITWRPNRNKRHELFNGRVYDKVVPAHVNAFLNDFGPEIPGWIFESLAHDESNKEGNPIFSVVRHADQISVEHDLKSLHSRGDGSVSGIPVQDHIIDCMRRQIHKDRWKPNEKGNPVWVDYDGNVFLIWSKAASDVIAQLNELGIPGVLRDQDSIAETLFHAGLIAKNPNADACGCHPMYWQIQPAELSIGNASRPMINIAVKLSTATTLFSTKTFGNPTDIKVFDTNPFAKQDSGKQRAVVEIPETLSKHKNKGEAKGQKILSEPHILPEAILSAASAFSDAEEVQPPQDTLSKGRPSIGSAPNFNNVDDQESAKRESDLLLATEILGKSLIDSAVKFPSPPCKSMLSISWPLEGLGQDEALDKIAELAEADILFVDRNDPYRQVFADKGSLFLVLNIKADYLPEVEVAPDDSSTIKPRPAASTRTKFVPENIESAQPVIREAPVVLEDASALIQPTSEDSLFNGSQSSGGNAPMQSLFGDTAHQAEPPPPSIDNEEQIHDGDGEIDISEPEAEPLSLDPYDNDVRTDRYPLIAELETASANIKSLLADFFDHSETKNLPGNGEHELKFFTNHSLIDYMVSVGQEASSESILNLLIEHTKAKTNSIRRISNGFAVISKKETHDA